MLRIDNFVCVVAALWVCSACVVFVAAWREAAGSVRQRLSVPGNMAWVCSRVGCVLTLCCDASSPTQALTPRGRRVELREPLEVAWLAQVSESLRNVACRPAHICLTSAARSALDHPASAPLPWIPPTTLLNKPASTPSLHPSLWCRRLRSTGRLWPTRASPACARLTACSCACAWRGRASRCVAVWVVPAVSASRWVGRNGRDGCVVGSASLLAS